jgi:hypothetical protein
MERRQAENNCFDARTGNHFGGRLVGSRGSKQGVTYVRISLSPPETRRCYAGHSRGFGSCGLRHQQSTAPASGPPATGGYGNSTEHRHDRSDGRCTISVEYRRHGPQQLRRRLRRRLTFSFVKFRHSTLAMSREGVLPCTAAQPKAYLGSMGTPGSRFAGRITKDDFTLATFLAAVRVLVTKPWKLDKSFATHFSRKSTSPESM